MSYLIDTNVISEFRKGKRCNPHVSRWIEDIGDAEIFISVLTIGELRRGIDSIHRRDPKSAADLSRWLKDLLEMYKNRILGIDLQIAEEWGRLNVPDPLPVIDSLLAATASVHRLSLVTRNTKDIARTGVPYLNPFA